MLLTRGNKIKAGYAILFAALTFFFILNLLVGSVSIPLSELKLVFFKPDQADATILHIVFQSRLPQTITAFLAGAALAVTGLQLQTLFRNPLADPSILGISSGAGLGVALLVMMAGSFGFSALSALGFLGNFSISLMAFFGAFGVLVLILNLSRKLNNNAILLIVGIMIGYASGAIIDILKFFSPKEDVYAFVIWGMGSFANVSNEQLVYMAPTVIIGLIWAMFMIKPLNILHLGDYYGANLGLNIRVTRYFVLANTGLLSAVVTAFCGPIAFIGLAVPHLAKSLMKTSNHSILLPSVMIAGGTLALVCNLIARLPGFDGTLPINSVTAFVGAPVVVWVLIKKRRETGF